MTKSKPRHPIEDSSRATARAARISDYARSNHYRDGVQHDLSQRVPTTGYVTAATAEPATPAPCAFYRRINFYAWAAMIAVGATGWVVILKLF